MKKLIFFLAIIVSITAKAQCFTYTTDTNAIQVTGLLADTCYHVQVAFFVYNKNDIYQLSRLEKQNISIPFAYNGYQQSAYINKWVLNWISQNYKNQ